MAQTNIAICHSTQSSPGSPRFREEVENLINRLFFAETQSVLALLEWIKKRRERKQCGRIIGGHGTGKTEASNYCVAELSGQKGSIRGIPFIAHYVQCFSSCSSRDLCGLIQDSLKRNIKKGKPRDFRLRTWDFLEMYGVEVLLVDNAHFLTEKALADIIELSRLYGISVILIGVTELDSILDGKFDLLRPFNHFFRFSALSLDQFISTLETFQIKFLGLPESSGFISNDAISTLFNFSEGNFYNLVELLVDVVCESSSHESLRFDKSVLDTIVMEYGLPTSQLEKLGSESAG